MDVKELFPSKYLKGEDLTAPVNVLIQTVRTENMFVPGVGERARPVLYCVNGSKGIVLGKALAFSIAETLDAWDMNDWEGKRVQLYPVPVQVKGKPAVGIRARAVQNGHA